jgi:hypothetical protein
MAGSGAQFEGLSWLAGRHSEQYAYHGCTRELRRKRIS